MADTGILSLDDHVIRLIIDELSFLDFVAFRATCSRFRKMFHHPGKLTPQECVKRGLRSGNKDVVKHAQIIGAQDLMQYIGEDFQYCHRLWCAHKWKGHSAAIKKCDQWKKFREILDEDNTTISKACRDGRNIVAAFRIGRAEVPRVIIRIIDKLLGIQDVTRDIYVMLVIGNVIMGCFASTHSHIAQELLTKYRRIACEPKYSTILVPKLVREESARTCASVFTISADDAAKMMIHAARSGRPETCEYIASISGSDAAVPGSGAPIRIVDMFRGAARSDSIEVFELARKWFGGADDSHRRAWCLIGPIVHKASIIFDACGPSTYPYVHDTQCPRSISIERNIAYSTLEWSCEYGSRAVAERARGWFKSIDMSSGLNYTALFRLAAKGGHYRMSSQIYQWSLDDHIKCDVECLRYGDEYTLAQVALRATHGIVIQ